MMACGQEVVIVADHTKFGRLSLWRTSAASTRSITWSADPGLPDAYRSILEAERVAIHLAPLEAESKNGAINGVPRTDGPRTEA